MTDKVEQIRNGVKRLLNEPTPSHDSQCNWEDGYWCALYKIEEFIDSMQEEHVNYDKLKTMLNDALAKETKESLNERLGEEPKAKFKKGDTIRYTDGDIRTVVEVREDCYKLDDFSILHFNAQDNWELVREPVSEIAFEQELYKAFGRVKDFTLGMQIAKWFYEMGRKYHEPVSGLDNGDMPIERWKQAVKAASNQRSYRSSKGLTETRDDYFVDGVQWADEHPKEEPVSVWHDAKKLPDNPEDIVIEHSEYGTAIIPACKMSRVKGAKWARLDDIFKL